MVHTRKGVDSTGDLSVFVGNAVGVINCVYTFWDLLIAINGSQLAKMKKSIPDTSLA